MSSAAPAHPPRITARALVACALAVALGACGNGTQEAKKDPNAAIEFTAEEQDLLERTDTVAAPSGPVSRDNYRQQLDVLEREINAEAGR